MAMTLTAASNVQTTSATATPRAVFIGGTGQSGVSTLNQMLSRHPLVLTCHLETSFIIAANGVRDVVRAISTEYSPMRLDAIVHEFDRLLHHHLCSPRSYPYSGFDLASYFGAQRYHRAVEDFLSDLGIVRHPGDGLTIGPAIRAGSVHGPFKLRGLRLPAAWGRERTYLYQASRLDEVAALTAAQRFVDRLFGAKARAEGKVVWCEQSSCNQQAADFLIAMFPDSLYINVTRDPLDVALAHRKQSWSSPDFKRVCASLRDLYGRWFEVRDRLPSGSVVEVRFEDLVGRPATALANVCGALGVALSAEAVEALKPDPARLVREEVAAADLKTYRSLLGETAEKLGYRA